MTFGLNQLRIIVALTDEKGHGNNELTRIIYGDAISRGNTSSTLKTLMKSGIIENLKGDGTFEKDNIYLRKDIKIFENIIQCLYKNHKRYFLKSRNLEDEFEFLKAHGAWADNRMIDFINEANGINENDQFVSKALNDFTFSRYTGKIIKKYGLKIVLESIPRMKIEEFIKFVDWANEEGFVDDEFYPNFILSLSNFMIDQFEMKSEKAADIIEVMHESIKS